MDVEIKLQQALTVSKNAFLSQISALNDEMGQDQTKLFQEVNGKVSEFKGKLIEELNKEKDDFQEKLNALQEGEDEEDVYRDYENTPAQEEVIELLVDGENKDAVDELINSFSEKLESKLQEEESYISRLRKSEQEKLENDIKDAQYLRNRNVVMEILQLTKTTMEKVCKYTL